MKKRRTLRRRYGRASSDAVTFARLPRGAKFKFVDPSSAGRGVHVKLGQKAYREEPDNGLVWGAGPGFNPMVVRQ